MKTVLPALLLAVGFVPAPVISAPPAAPTAAQVDALLDAMDFEASQRAMLAQMDASMQELTTSMMGEDATAEDRARMAEIDPGHDRVLSQSARPQRDAQDAGHDGHRHARDAADPA